VGVSGVRRWTVGISLVGFRPRSSKSADDGIPPPLTDFMLLMSIAVLYDYIFIFSTAGIYIHGVLEKRVMTLWAGALGSLGYLTDTKVREERMILD